VLGCNETIRLSHSGAHHEQRCAVADPVGLTETRPEWTLTISKFPEVWAKDKYDCGLAQIQPLSIPGPMHVAKRQYPLKNEAREGAS